MQAHLPKAPDGILLIDSNPDIQLALTDLLEAQGYRVRCAASGAEAITAMEEGGPYATVLLDPALPDMDGIRLIKEVSGLDPHLPVIVLTGHVESDHEIRAFHEGVLAFIRKPYNREQIIALLSRAVEVRKLGLKVVDMERALKESEEKFQLTVEHINDGVMYVDGSGVIVWANQQVGALLGHTLPNVIGHSLLEHVSPVGPSLKDSRVEQVLAVGTLNPMQAFKVTWPDGTQRWLEANVSDVVHQGKPTGQLLVVRDITESKLGEVALMERNHLLELDTEVASIIDDSNDIPTLLQGCAEALVRHLDAALARIWCLDETKQVLQLHASAGMYTHLDGAHSRVPVGEYKIGLIAAEGKPILTNEVIGDRRIPEQAWAKREGLVAFAGYPLLSQQEVLGVMALFARHPLPAVTLNSLATVAHRITVGLARQKATEENTRLVRFTQSLLASAGEGIYGLDLDGHTTFVNPAAATMLGYTPEELLGTPMHERVHHSKPDGTPYPRETCPMYAAFNDGMVHQVEDEVLWRKDGTSFPVSYMSTPRWEDGQLVGAVVTFQDISERKQAEATIRKSEQRFRAIYDQAPVGIAILDSVGAFRALPTPRISNWTLTICKNF
jgi:PAS domain S-box-containing protein